MHKAYRNLNRRDGVYFSLSHRGRVIGHRQIVVLVNVTFKHPTAAALLRVRGGRREVCAWILGTLASDQTADTQGMRRLACDPKKVDTFCDAATGETIDSATRVVLCSTGAFYSP